MRLKVETVQEIVLVLLLVLEKRGTFEDEQEDEPPPLAGATFNHTRLRSQGKRIKTKNGHFDRSAGGKAGGA